MLLLFIGALMLTAGMEADLLRAIAHFPRKGRVEYPCKKSWYVVLNLHEWALKRGFLTAAVMRQPGYRKRSTKYRLQVVVQGRKKGWYRFHASKLTASIWDKWRRDRYSKPQV